ncbi:MAG TPA: Do family serine endopeptidase [Bacteroidota bacterium]|nr:Do family serine endopeptidase [Bacteroidota bacterium]
MVKKSAYFAVILLLVGALFGAFMIFGFDGTNSTYAQGVKIGKDKPSEAILNLQATSDAFVAIAKEITPKVVTIEVTTKPSKSSKKDLNEFFKFFGPDFELPDQQPQHGAGSGVIISSDGYILTNNHVVKDADENNGIKVTTFDRKIFYAKIIGTDEYTDLAVIKVDAKNLEPAYLGNSDEVQVGQIVLAVGNPLGLNSTVTHGIISALGRNINIIDDKRTGYGIENFFQTDAAINPGNSGGALVDLKGAVIGINTAIATSTGYNQGYGFAIPINLAKKVAEDIIKTGKVRRGFIGIKMDNRMIDETTAKALGLSKATGVLVQEVVSGGAADKAGIKSGDVLLEVDGKEVSSPSQLQEIVARKHPGDEVKLKIFRDGKTFDKVVTLMSKMEDSSLAESSTTKEEETTTKSNKTEATFDNIGLSVKNMTSEEKSKYKVDYGILVTKAKNFGIAQSRGIIEGTVITDVIKKGSTIPIKTVGDFEKIIKESKSGDAFMVRLKTEIGPRLVAIEIP